MYLKANDKMLFEEWRQENFFSNLSDSAAKSLNLFENLLVWSRCQLGELSFYPRIFILKGSISSVIDLLKGVALDKGITIVEELSPNLNVYADQRMIEVVLRNLISNAIKFTNVNGQLNINVSMEKEFAKVVIIDNGLGMTKEKVESILI